VTLPDAGSGSPPSLPRTGTATSKYVNSSVDILCARVVRRRDQMMAVSAD